MKNNLIFQCLLCVGVLSRTSIAGVLFPHVDCYDIHGRSTGVRTNLNGSQKAGLVEGYQFMSVSQMRTAGLSVTTTSEPLDDAFPIPPDCFKKGSLQKDDFGTMFDLGRCKAGREPGDMLHICLSVCRKVASCAGVVYSGHSLAGRADCYLHSTTLDPERCGHYPYRFNCASRKPDEYLGVFCPAKLPSWAYAPDNLPPRPSVPPTTYRIGGKLSLAPLANNPQHCNDATFQAALVRTLKATLGVGHAYIQCPQDQTIPGIVKLVYYIEIQPSLDVHAIRARIDGNKCDGTNGPLCSTANFWQNVFHPQLGQELGVPSAPTVQSASETTWSMPESQSPAGSFETDATFHEYQSCVAGGKLTGFQVAPDFVSTMWLGIETLPEQHASIQPFFKSMWNPNDWYPIPEGCFNDFTYGTPSNPAIPKGGKHYELLDKKINGVTYDCLGNRTQEEMVRICLTICRAVNYAQDPSEPNKYCIAVNYDEHGGSKGHCHMYSPHDHRVIAYNSQSCSQTTNINKVNVEGFCMSYPGLKDHTLCQNLGLAVGGTLKNSPHGGNYCGRKNFMAVACHFDPFTCITSGHGATLDASGNPVVCDACPTGKFSKLYDKPWQNRSIIPFPTQMQGVVNFCDTCADGEWCDRGLGCSMAAINAGSCPPPCPTGTYGIKGQCLPCLAGKFSNATGQTACQACNPGTFQWRSGSTACENCPLGRHAPVAETKVCVACGQGKYAAVVGQSKCTACPSTFTTEWQSSEKLEDCMCPGGDYLPCLPSNSCALSNPAGLSCVACPLGFRCPGNSNNGTHAQPVLDQGLYASKDFPYQAYECKHAQELCLGGLAESCGGERHGLQCSNCNQGQHSRPGGVCKPCDDNGSYFLIPLGIIGAGIIIVGLYRATKANTGELFTRLPVLSTFGLIVSHAQLFAVVSMFDVNWPKLFKDAMDAILLFVFRIEILRPSCFLGFGMGARYIPGLLVPVGLLVIILLMFWASHFMSKVSSSVQKMDMDHTLNTVGLLLSALFIAVCKSTLNLFECRPNPSAPDTMRLYDGFMCRDDAILPLLPLTIAATLIFIIGFPIILLWAIKVGPSTFHRSSSYRTRFAFFLHRWNPRFYYWGILVMFRNMLVSMVAVVTSDPLMQLILMLMIFIPIFVGQLVYQPYREELMNILDLFMSSSLIITVVLAIALLPEPTGQTRDQIGVFMLITFLVAVGSVGVVLIDGLNVLLKRPTIFTLQPLDKEFQVDFVGTMLKFQMLFDLGEENLIRDLRKFLSELPMSDGKLLSRFLGIIDVGLFGNHNRAVSGIPPNAPREDERSQEVNEKGEDRIAQLRALKIPDSIPEECMSVCSANSCRSADLVSPRSSSKNLLLGSGKAASIDFKPEKQSQQLILGKAHGQDHQSGDASPMLVPSSRPSFRSNASKHSGNGLIPVERPSIHSKASKQSELFSHLQLEDEPEDEDSVHMQHVTLNLMSTSTSPRSEALGPFERPV